MDKRFFARAVLVAIVALLAACASERPSAPAPREAGPPDFPYDVYLRLAEQGQRVLRIDPDRSLVVIEVRRAGSLASLGHDHVVASHAVHGYLAPGQGRADLYAPLDALVVDEPALREEAGLQTRPSAADIDATRHNMLEKVLEADRYPFVQIAVNGAVLGAGDEQPLRIQVTLHGSTRYVDARVAVKSAVDEARVTGSFAIDQSQFGIVPFSVFGGAIAVADRVEIRFRLLARRADEVRPPAPPGPRSEYGELRTSD